MLVKNKKILKFYYLIILLSFMHSILRLNDTSSFSLYRVLMPISLFLLIFFYKKSIFPTIIVLFLILYNFILSYFYTDNFSHYIALSLHYVSILNIYLVVLYIYRIDGFEKLYKFLYYFILLSLFIAITEIIFQYRLPNTAIYFDGSVSAFNWNQNEFGAILLSFSPFLLVFEKNNFIKTTIISIILYLMYINDSKLALIGLLIGIVIYNLKKNILQIHPIIKKIIIFLSLLCIPILIYLPYDNIYVSFRDYDISLYTLLGIPIEHILSLTPFPDTGGSDTTRANAIIYALIEFKNSYFMGIGCGNTLTMLEKPEYTLKTAKSIHNLPIQLVVENGFIILIGYALLIKIFFKLFLVKHKLDQIDLLLVVAIPSLFIGMMGSSVGIFSDYFLISSISLIYILKKYRKKL